MVSHWLESLLLAHDKPDLLLSTVTHELGVTSASLLPLLVVPAVQLDAVSPQALEVLKARLGLDLVKSHLSTSKQIQSAFL